MALIIEDGTGKEDSQSYVTAAELRTFATLRGVTLPVDDSEVEPLLVMGLDYLGTYEGNLQGRRKNPAQALSFPRVGLTVNCAPYADDKIPQAVKNAQMQAALEIFAGTTDLNPSTTTFPVYREKVDSIERQFMTPRQLSTTPDGSGFTPIYPKIDSFMFPVLQGNECPGTGVEGITRSLRI